jgi:hypothetical protein
MLKRTRWKLDAVLSLKLRDDLYTLAQTRTNCLTQFFDIRSADGQWSGVDLNAVDPLFCIYVADNRMKPIIDAVVKDEQARPNIRPLPRIMLSALPIVGEKYKCAVNLVESGDSFESVSARVLKANLSPANDSKDLRTYELTGMWGNPDQLAKRLIRYFDIGVNWDDSKSFIFGDDLPPPAPER